MPRSAYSTWPTPGYEPIGLSVGGVTGFGGDVVRVERVTYSKGPITERRPAYGVPEGNLGCTVLPDGSSRIFNNYEHSMTEETVKYKAMFEFFPDISPRDRLIWLNVGGAGIEKILTVSVVVYDNSKAIAFWIAHCEEHMN